VITGALVAGMGRALHKQARSTSTEGGRDQMANGEWQKGPLN
jgi:hypothetical protein